jgi:hypothetical protein
MPRRAPSVLALTPIRIRVGCLNSSIGGGEGGVDGRGHGTP